MGKLLGYRVHAGFGMNIANSYTLMWAKNYGIESAELSCELDIKRIERLYKSIPVGIMRYGNMPLMITRNTPAGAELSCKNDGYLQDRKDEKFIIRHREGYCEIYNWDKDKDLKLEFDDYKEGLTAIISVKITEAQFEGQTKAKLGNTIVRSMVSKLISEELISTSPDR